MQLATPAVTQNGNDQGDTPDVAVLCSCVSVTCRTSTGKNEVVVLLPGSMACSRKLTGVKA